MVFSTQTLPSLINFDQKSSSLRNPNDECEIWNRHTVVQNELPEEIEVEEILMFVDDVGPLILQKTRKLTTRTQDGIKVCTVFKFCNR